MCSGEETTKEKYVCSRKGLHKTKLLTARTEMVKDTGGVWGG